MENLSLYHYTKQLLGRFGTKDCKIAPKPVFTDKTPADSPEQMNQKIYHEIDGAFSYLFINSRTESSVAMSYTLHVRKRLTTLPRKF